MMSGDKYKIIRSRDFNGERAWQALPVAKINGSTVRLHWTDQAYHWHQNDGQEVFVVLDGEVDMHWRDEQGEQCQLLQAGDIFYAGIGCEHVAHPRGVARVLVVENEGSE